MAESYQLRQKDFFHDRYIPVVVTREPNQEATPVHHHDFVEIVFILEGEGTHWAGSSPHAIAAGDVLVINRGFEHRYEDTRSLSLVNILIRTEALRSAKREMGRLDGFHALFTLDSVRRKQDPYASRLRLGSGDLRRAVQWIDAMEAETHRLEHGGRILARSWLFLLIGLLARRYGEIQLHPGHEIRLGRVLASIDRDPTAPASTGELAAEAGMSERTFYRHFREATGLTPALYRLRARLERAAEMLADPGETRSITEIALACGFDDSNYFSRQFRQQLKVTPSAWRSPRS